MVRLIFICCLITGIFAGCNSPEEKTSDADIPQTDTIAKPKVRPNPVIQGPNDFPAFLQRFPEFHLPFHISFELMEDFRQMVHQPVSPETMTKETAEKFICQQEAFNCTDAEIRHGYLARLPYNSFTLLLIYQYTGENEVYVMVVGEGNQVMDVAKIGHLASDPKATRQTAMFHPEGRIEILRDVPVAFDEDGNVTFWKPRNSNWYVLEDGTISQAE